MNGILVTLRLSVWSLCTLRTQWVQTALCNIACVTRSFVRCPAAQMACRWQKSSTNGRCQCWQFPNVIGQWRWRHGQCFYYWCYAVTVRLVSEVILYFTCIPCFAFCFTADRLQDVCSSIHWLVNWKLYTDPCCQAPCLWLCRCSCHLPFVRCFARADHVALHSSLQANSPTDLFLCCSRTLC